MTLDTPIEFIKGIGQERADLIKNALHIKNVRDFLQFYPIRYIDKSKIYLIKDLDPSINIEIRLKGKITHLEEINNGKNKRLSASFSDGTGSISLVWFQYSRWLKEQIPLNQEIYIFGKINFFNGFSMPHPEIESIEKEKNYTRLLPIYPSSEKLNKRGINQKFFQKILYQICQNLPQMVQENLSLEIIKFLSFISHQEAILNIHFPENTDSLHQAERRLKFEEAFFFQLGHGIKKQIHQTQSVGNPFRYVGDFFKNFYENHLPFPLTGAQKKVLKEIYADLKRPIQMNRLLQGDVGSGKTIVALFSMLMAIDNGFQSALMAPTEILAQQHFNNIKELLAPTEIQVQLLTGSTKTKERKEIHQNLLSGQTSIIIGTHALLEPVVKFKNLGLAIIDEQHRFGVEQRAKLWAKNSPAPHILVMTATPIPRTLAMSFYSDLDVSVIDELPLGRKPIITAHKKENERLNVYEFAKEELKKGRQIYFVFPLIEESENLDYQNLIDGFESISQYFSSYQCVMIHGRMKPKEKDENMMTFAQNKAQIMVATTVIEVGVNVPNASVMIIENAEKFGLSQLHQLRGRVGRGAEQSFCILMSKDKISKEARLRLKTMCQTNDGFKISEVDMQLRGPGDILGTKQSGNVDFKKLDLITDGMIVKTSKTIVDKILNQDPYLLLEKNLPIKNFYKNFYLKQQKWSKIS